MGPPAPAGPASPSLDLDHSTQADPSVASPADAGDATTAPIRSLAATQFAALPPGTATFATKAACELWAKDNIATPVLAQLNQPFGEDRLTQSFTVVAAFRHVLCPIIKSGFFLDSDLAALEQAYAPAASVGWVTPILAPTATTTTFCPLWRTPKSTMILSATFAASI
jgi:hypothetical protein